MSAFRVSFVSMIARFGVARDAPDGYGRKPTPYIDGPLCLKKRSSFFMLSIVPSTHVVRVKQCVSNDIFPHSPHRIQSRYRFGKKRRFESSLSPKTCVKTRPPSLSL